MEKHETSKCCFCGLWASLWHCLQRKWKKRRKIVQSKDGVISIEYEGEEEQGKIGTSGFLSIQPETRRGLSVSACTLNIGQQAPSVSSGQLSLFGFTLRTGSQPTSPRPTTVTPVSGHRSPSNYCRVATCEKLHLHDLTPKCLETFAPSSTCSSCQTCARQHIGPNHDQVLMVSRLVRHLPPEATPSFRTHRSASTSSTGKTRTSSALLMQWPLPEYRPQHSPEHIYRSFGF